MRVMECSPTGSGREKEIARCDAPDRLFLGTVWRTTSGHAYRQQIRRALRRGIVPRGVCGAGATATLYQATATIWQRKSPSRSRGMSTKSGGHGGWCRRAPDRQCRNGGVTLGGAIGASAGVIGGFPGIAIGAASGAGLGLVIGLLGGTFKPLVPDPPYADAVEKCLRDKGYEVNGWQ
jgi:hypothetical protein